LVKSKYNKTSGNMLLIVLIGIALFAALMFALTRNNKYDTGASENAAIEAQEITSYASKINDAVQNMMMQNHCLASQLRFTSGASGSCQVFDQSGTGGGIVYKAPPPQAVDNASFAAAGSPAGTPAGSYLFEGNICVTGSGSSCSAGGSALVFIMPWVTEAVCAQIDWITMKSAPTTGNFPTVSAASFDGTTFTGTYAGTYTLTTSGTTFPSGCYYSSASPPGTGYHFYEVLQAN
jgi:hypothetical protein